MTLTELKAAVMTVVQQIVTDHTAYPLVVQTANNDVIDQVSQTNPYLVVVVKPMLGKQADIGKTPYKKQTGQIQIAAVVKDGAGTADAGALLDFVLPYLDLKALGTLQCEAAYPVGGRELKGWWYESAIVPYYYFTQ